MLEIPVNPQISSDFTFTVILDLVECKFRLIWNTKTQYWMVNIYEEPDNNLIFNGLKILPNYPFLYTYGPSFSGEIICLKMGRDTEEEITYDNFGTGWKLFYFTAEEFSETTQPNL
jgi:hypothetical protein